MSLLLVESPGSNFRRYCASRIARIVPQRAAGISVFRATGRAFSATEKVPWSKWQVSNANTWWTVDVLSTRPALSTVCMIHALPIIARKPVRSSHTCSNPYSDSGQIMFLLLMLRTGCSLRGGKRLMQRSSVFCNTMRLLSWGTSKREILDDVLAPRTPAALRMISSREPPTRSPQVVAR